MKPPPILQPLQIIRNDHWLHTGHVQDAAHWLNGILDIFW